MKQTDDTTSGVKISTNNQPRELLAFHELPEPIRQTEFDYVTGEIEQHTPRFFQYRDWWYDSHEFLTCLSTLNLSDWHGYQPDSFFSGVVIRFTEDYEQVIVGTYTS